jgi:hypothetical protein
LVLEKLILFRLVPDKLIVLNLGKGVCADPVERGAILEEEGPGPPSGDSERQLNPDRGVERRDKMRKWQEVEEDYPVMASECELAQSKFTCIASGRKCKYPQ